MAKIDKCPYCPAGTKPVMIIGGGCSIHQNMAGKKPPTVKEILTVAPKKKAKPIKKVSDKQKAINAKYNKDRKIYMGTLSECEAKLPGCTIKPTQLHHKGGRIGEAMLDTNTWMGVCHSCHERIHSKDAEAREKGFLTSRHKK